MTTVLASPKKIRDICLFLSAQFETGLPLSDEQRLFLAKIFKAIGEGEDPNVVFGQQRGKGESKLAESKVEKIGIVLQSVATDLTIAKREGRALKISEAIRMNLDLANSVMGYRIHRPVITEKEVRRWWETPKYRGFKNPYRSTLSRNS